MTIADDERARVVAEAIEWLGTPFRDMGEIKGSNGGVDCAKYIKCVFRNAGVVDDIQIGTYSPQWFLHQGEELYMNEVARHAREVDVGATLPGDVVLFRIGRCYAHGGIVVGDGWPMIAHAYSAARMVIVSKGNDGYLGQAARKPRFFSRW